MKKWFIVLILALAISFAGFAQDYMIFFQGGMESQMVDSVAVKNLANGAEVKIGGSDVVHLLPEAQIRALSLPCGSITVYPNPLVSSCQVLFTTGLAGNVTIRLFDISGKCVMSEVQTLQTGLHRFEIDGIEAGVYSLMVMSGELSYHAKLVSTGSGLLSPSIEYKGCEDIPADEAMIYQTKDVSLFPYSYGDVLLFTAESGMGHTTISTLVHTPTDTLTGIHETTIQFDFITCTDISNQSYPIVKIGTQYWMAENLNTAQYSDTSLITEIQDISAWIETNTGAWCYFDNLEANGGKFGKLYNWYAAGNVRNICPQGWKLPTDEDWGILEMYLGLSVSESDSTGWRGDKEGCFLKDAGTGEWQSQSGTDINLTGFSALPAGMRNFTGNFFYDGQNATWWTASESHSLNAWSRALSYESCAIYRHDGRKIMGMSVRCIKEAGESLPVVTTDAASHILMNSFEIGGEVVSDNGSPVSARGVVFGYSPEPALDNCLGFTEDGSGTGIFSSVVEGLEPDSLVYVRAYATNSEGTAYGDEVQVTTLAALFTEGAGVYDFDGNFYRSIIVNGTEWTAANLKTSTYSTGLAIQKITDNTSWTGAIDGAYCWYNNDSTLFNENYGKLYNWFAVESGDLCPTGWHVPTNDEWLLLIEFLGGDAVAGGKMKDTDPEMYWYPENTGATNTGGLGLRASGMRDYSNGGYNHYGMYSHVWTATEVSANNAYMKRVAALDEAVTGWIPDKKHGGAVRCVKDPTGSPVVSTLPVTYITATTAKSGGNITETGGWAIIERGMIWSASPNVSFLNYYGLTQDGSGTGIYNSNMTGLIENTTYYCRAYVTTTQETVFGDELSFTTGSLLFTPGAGMYDMEGNFYQTVVVGTQEWATASLRTAYYNDGTPIQKITDAGQWSTTTDGAYCWYDSDSTSYDLEYGKLYNWAAVSSNKLCPGGWHVPDKSEWATLITAAGGETLAGGFLKSTETIQTGTGLWQEPNTGANNETGFTGDPGGYRYFDGSFGGVGEWGCWWGATSYNADSAWYMALGYNVENAFLLADYNENGFSVRCIKDLGSTAVITTSPVTNITMTTAISGGEITDDGGSTIISRGVVWSTMQNPSTVNNEGMTNDGTGSGVFTSNLTSLSPGTSYYIRAYASNAFGTSYGDELSFSTPMMLYTPGSGVVDYDGNPYNTIILNGKEFMAENLSTSTFRDGSALLEVTDNASWTSMQQMGAYCYYNNDQATYGQYGKLYNFAAAGDWRICPAGWHIPTDDEFKLLEEFLGVESGQTSFTGWRGLYAGGKLKEEGLSHWADPNLDADNSSGFTALPGGYRSYDGTFSDIGLGFYMWTSTESSTYVSWMRALSYDKNMIYRSTDEKTSGYSIRCVKNEVILATVLTYEPQNITINAATSGGFIENDGGAAAVVCGVVWSTSTGPTVEFNEGLTTDIPDAGEFVSYLTGLTSQTTYYVRAYATNEAGTSYGDEFEFSTPAPFVCGDNITFYYNGADVTYGTVSFAGRCWLDRDLGATQVAITEADANAYGDLFQWGREDDGHQLRTSGTTETLAPAQTQPGHNLYIYNPGDYYDWNEDENWITRWTDGTGTPTAADPCPDGWHVPAVEDWQNAITTGGWTSIIDAFASPLKLVLGGDRSGFKGVFNEGMSGTYWTGAGSAGGLGTAYYMSAGSISQTSMEFPYGFAIRCIKTE